MGFFNRSYQNLPEHAENEKFDLKKDFPEYSGWEMIGFHRPLGDRLREDFLYSTPNQD